MQNIYGRLSKWFCKEHGIKPTTEYEIEYVDPWELVCPERIDLIVKYQYVRMHEAGKDMRRIREIYRAHIEAFSEGAFVEPGQEKNKKSIENYFAAFDQLIESIKKYGFLDSISAVPVNEDNVILNGSHRVAIALYFGLKVPCVRLPGIRLKADYSFFYDRYLPQNCLDYMAVGYCAIKRNIYAALLWPAGYRAMEKGGLRQQVLDKLSAGKSLVCVKELKVSYRECDSLVISAYDPAGWLGKREDGFPGSKGKTDACFVRGGKMLFVLLEEDRPQELLERKAVIRKLLGADKHSIHITDTYGETVTVIKAVFYEKSRRWKNFFYDTVEGRSVKKMVRNWKTKRDQ